jgi:hypothetical protein
MTERNLLESKFARIGARLKVVDPAERTRQRFMRTAREGSVTLDIASDRDGEFFEIARLPHTDTPIDVLDVRPSDRHLLLMVRESSGKRKFLCGHDERHWFVAAVPEKAPVGTVRAAKEALKPQIVRAAQARIHLSVSEGERRKNAAFRRQGEWFFIPVGRKWVPQHLVLRNEPISRGSGGKPHWVEFCYRTGGETVYVCPRHPTGVSGDRYRRILADNPKAQSWGWQTLQRNPQVFARGRVRHPDHRTIMLHEWHQVVMNTENESLAMQHVVFLD